MIIEFLSAYCQETDEDSLWNLEDLDYSELEALRAPKKIEESHGWFPLSPAGMGQFGFLPAFAGDNFDVADFIRSKSFAPTSNPFSGNIFLDDKERVIKKKNKMESYPVYPITSHGGIGFDYMYSPGIYINLYSRVVVSQTTGLLFSKEPTKHFLTKNGTRKKLKEAGILYLNEWSLNLSIGVQLPIYGAFLKVGEIGINSYYYLNVSPSADLVFWSGATQYLQIANAKSDLRYNNGRDTLQLFESIAMGNINRFRFGLDCAIGWNGGVGPIGLGFELFSYIPLSSVIDDATWKQYKFGFRWKLIFPDYQK